MAGVLLYGGEQPVRHERRHARPALTGLVAAGRFVGGQGTRRPETLLWVGLRVAQHAPQPLDQRILVRCQGVPDDRHFLRLGVEQPPIKVLHLAVIHGQQGQAGVQPPAGVPAAVRPPGRLAEATGSVQRRYPFICVDGGWHLSDFGVEDLPNQPGGMGRPCSPPRPSLESPARLP